MRDRDSAQLLAFIKAREVRSRSRAPTARRGPDAERLQSQGARIFMTREEMFTATADPTSAHVVT
jgi:hypothetical protein